MSSLTQDQEIQNFITEAPRKYTGLIMDNSLQGRANSNSIASYVLGRGLPLTMENLDAAVVALQFLLFWTAGNEPVVAPSDNRTRAQKAYDGGITPHQKTHSDKSETTFARDVREGREKHVADNIRRERDALRYTETHQTVISPSGRTNYAAQNTLNEEARQRHLAEDARESGRPIPVQTGFRVIPEGTTDFTPYSPDELKAHLAKHKGGYLLR
jgi:hypothetical protein